MKKIIIGLGLATVCFAACNKENNIENIPAETQEVLTAVIEQDAFTKTNYTISGATASFEWSEGDSFGRMIKNTSSDNFSTCTFNATSINGNTATFSGVSAEYSTSYAIYPVASSNGANITIDNSSALYFNIPSEINYDVNNPLKNIIPMIGKYNETQFTFYPISGVIGLRAINIPSNATSITLSSSSDKAGMSGKSVKITDYNLDDTGHTGMGQLLISYGLKRGWMSSNGTGVSLKFSAGSFTEGDFYFPVPPTYSSNGTTISTFPYADLTITLKADDEVLSTVSATGINLSVNRAQIVVLPNIDFASCNMDITGSADNFSVYIKSASSLIKTVKVAIANTEAEAISNAASGTAITQKGESYAVNISSGLSDTGKYYIGYVGYDVNDNNIVSESFPVYFINSSDKTKYTGTYTFSTLKAFTANATSSWIDITSKSNTMTIAVSDDPKEGYFMLTDFIGFNYSGTMTNTSLCGENALIKPTSGSVNFDGTYGGGNPQYGYFNSKGWLVFAIGKPFFSLDGTRYYPSHGQAQYSEWGFTETDNGSRITLTGTSSNNTLCFVKESSLKTSGDYTASDICVKFGGSAPVAYKDYD